MDVITEMHMHSKYARACSEQLTLENMALTSQEKGIRIIATGDFTHPEWFNEIRGKLAEDQPGLFKVKGRDSATRFLLATEVCVAFSKNKSLKGNLAVFDKTGEVKRFHNCVLAPSIEVVEQINSALSKFGSLSYDGRPMLNMSAAALVELLHSIDKRIMVFPAHAYTPWFGVLGSFSGFDSIKEAYEDQEMHIHALETGLSSDPAMSWRISELDKYALVSGSDAHSLPKIGREATVFDIEEKNLSYDAIVDAIKNRKLKSTIEFYPEEGKYHYDGHRKCNLSLSPEQAEKYHDICPVCGKRLTLGVLHRVEDLADREPGYMPKGAAPFIHAIPLQEILAFISKKSTYSVYVKDTYAKLIERFGTEMNVLLRSDIDSLGEVDKNLARAIENVREDRVRIKPGYDGVFGIIDILSDNGSGAPLVQAQKHGQKSMGDF
jgi:uncharacterized protein (TIGR00375 family)